jgi:hypothetical protein
MGSRVWVVSLVACLVALPAWGGGIYKWTDKDGHVHFGDEPGSDDAQEMKVQKGPQAPDPATVQRIDDQKKYLDARQEERDKSQEQMADAKDKAKEQQAQCETAQKQLLFLNETPRLYTMEANGDRHYLSGAERDAEIAKATEAVSKLCGAQPAAANAAD